mmetsp:Transcript_93039/g.263293  ORF Transcript_93039/g.263293 Transcript_93039/m.263293 type:complete len:279 (-) Transcript_93039:1422-2258(-)
MPVLAQAVACPPRRHGTGAGLRAAPEERHAGRHQHPRAVRGRGHFQHAARGRGLDRVRVQRRRRPAPARHLLRQEHQLRLLLARAVQRPRRRGLREVHREGRRLRRHERARPDELGDAATGRADGRRPPHRLLRAGAHQRHGDRRVPGVPGDGDHGRVHEMELRVPRLPAAALGGERGVPHRHVRASRSRPHRPAEEHPVDAGAGAGGGLDEEGGLLRRRAAHDGHEVRGARRRAHQQGQAPDILRRPGRQPLPRARPVDCEKGLHPRDHHPPRHGHF